MKLFLLGLPRCGKSTLGKQLASHLLLPFIDLDGEIQHNTNTSIASLFHDQGEARFRKIEREILTMCCEKYGHFVMATGGGTPCFFSTMDYINGLGTSIFLDVPVTELARRMETSVQAIPPLLRDDESHFSITKLVDMNRQRRPYYQQAHYSIVGVALTIRDIEQCLQQHNIIL